MKDSILMRNALNSINNMRRVMDSEDFDITTLDELSDLKGIMHWAMIALFGLGEIQEYSEAFGDCVLLLGQLGDMNAIEWLEANERQFKNNRWIAGVSSIARKTILRFPKEEQRIEYLQASLSE